MRRSYKIPPYGAGLTVVRAEPKEHVRDALRRHHLPYGGIDDQTYAVAFFDPVGKAKDKGRWIVALPYRTSPYYLAHEATHVALSMAKWYHIKVDHDNDEPIAYLIGYITWLLDKTKPSKE